MGAKVNHKDLNDWTPFHAACAYGFNWSSAANVYKFIELLLKNGADNSKGDPTTAVDLLDQIKHKFNVVMGDGAYDSVKLTNAILNKQPEASIIIPPPSDAVISNDGTNQRDKHIRQLEDIGRMAWQKER